jgi:hypothetical protein
MGISRSASTVMAYLMKANKWTLDEAFTHTKMRRPAVQPNDGFWSELKVYEGMLRASDVKSRFNNDHKIAELLESIGGSYSAYRWQLENHFQTLDCLRQASVAELQQAGLPPAAAVNIYDALR